MKFVAACCLIFASASFVFAEENAAQLNIIDDLASHLREKLPVGWKVEITPWRQWSRGEGPVLSVFSERKVKLLLQWPGEPLLAANQEPRSHMAQQEIGLFLAAWLSPEAHVRTTKRNAAHMQRRLAFEEKLKDIPFAAKAPRPLLPAAYHPASAEQTRLVHQYTALCLQTPIEELPTHYWRNISMHLFDEWFYATAAEAADRAEFETALRAVRELLTAYPTPE